MPDTEPTTSTLTAGQLLRHWREELGWTRAEAVRESVAYGYRLSERQVQQAEESPTPKADVAAALMHALDVGQDGLSIYMDALRSAQKGAR